MRNLKQFPADWNNITVPGAVIKYNSYGKYNALAGHQRNAKMGDYADALIAVWNGKSTGTRNMIKYMKSLGSYIRAKAGVAAIVLLLFGI